MEAIWDIVETTMTRKDVFGKAIMDAFTGKKATKAIRRDDGYLDDEDISHYFVSFEEFGNHQTRIWCRGLRLVQTPSGIT